LHSPSLPRCVWALSRSGLCAVIDVLLHRLHYAPPGWDAAAERRNAQGEIHSAAQARAWADECGDKNADHGFAFDGVGRLIRA
jgi:hypothetical protein